MLFARKGKAGGEFKCKLMTLQQALCTKASDRAVPSYAMEHFTRRLKEYKALVNKGDKAAMCGMWKSWTRKATKQYYEKHTVGSEAVREHITRITGMISDS